MMTIPEFVERLKETQGPWRVQPWGAIRCGKQCPLLCVVTGDPPEDFWSAGDALGLSRDDTRRIVAAADHFDFELIEDGYMLRAQLLAATVNRS